jgi:hypothetical protein
VLISRSRWPAGRRARGLLRVTVEAGTRINEQLSDWAQWAKQQWAKQQWAESRPDLGQSPAPAAASEVP